MIRRLAVVAVAGLLAAGCRTKTELVLIAPDPDDTAERNPPLPRSEASPADDPWVRAGEPAKPGAPVRPPAPVYVRMFLDGRPAAPAADTDPGVFTVPGKVGLSPRFRYELTPAAGKFDRLVIVLSEFREGKADPATEHRILGLGQLGPDAEFPLDRPGSGVFIRTPAGGNVESVRLKPDTTYQAHIQVQTTTRREGGYWPQPFLRFTTGEK